MRYFKAPKGLAHIPLILLLTLVAVGGIAVGRSNLLDRFEKEQGPTNEAITKESAPELENVDLKQEEEKTPTFEIKKEPEEEKAPVKKEPEKDADTTEKITSNIYLTSKVKSDGIYLYWTVKNISIDHGFKIVKSIDTNPSFPEDGYIYVEDSSVRNYFLGLKDGKTWYIKVCRYDGSGGCDNYSNEIIFKAPDLGGDKSEDKDSNVDDIDLSVIKKSDDKVKLKWSVDGKAKKGFKVLWSKNSKPTYPLGDGDKFHYLSDSDSRTDYIDDLDDGEKYYFRVCEYLGGKCGTYSNQVSLEL